jgi:hypothetical protein
MLAAGTRRLDRLEVAVLFAIHEAGRRRMGLDGPRGVDERSGIE